MVDGVAIYDYLIDDSSKKVLVCRDVLASTSTGSFSTVEDVQGDAKYIPIEFGGAAAALLFYVSYVNHAYVHTYIVLQVSMGSLTYSHSCMVTFIIQNSEH